MYSSSPMGRVLSSASGRSGGEAVAFDDLGDDRHLVMVNGEEAAIDRGRLDPVAAVHAHLAGIEHHQGGRMPGQHAQVALDRAGRDHAGLTGPDRAVRGNEFHLKNDFLGGNADIRTDYGRATDQVVVGDWDGNGTTTPGVRRGTTFFLKNDFTGGGADVTFTFGELGDKVIVGKFTAGDSKETVGVYRPTAL